MELVERWQWSHEKECAKRWGTVVKILIWGGTAALSILLGVTGWGLNKTFEAQQEQMRYLRALVPAASAPAHLPGG